jgi:hypothetical protein
MACQDGSRAYALVAIRVISPAGWGSCPYRAGKNTFLQKAGNVQQVNLSIGHRIAIVKPVRDFKNGSSSSIVAALSKALTQSHL